LFCLVSSRLLICNSISIEIGTNNCCNVILYAYISFNGSFVPFTLRCASVAQYSTVNCFQQTLAFTYFQLHFLLSNAGHCAAKRRQHSGPLVYLAIPKTSTFGLTKCPLAEFFLGRVLSHIPFQKKIHRNFSQVRNSNCLSLITWPIWYQFLYLFFSNFLN
jgi:hypothetical protein